MKTDKPVQMITDERLRRDADLSKDEIARFLEDFRLLAQGDEGQRLLISLRVPERLLSAFKEKAKREGRPYQTQIVELMRAWVRK